jgi:hypothetical protein
MTPWFNDAIDARGGLAIATQRLSDLKLDTLDDCGASVFISPPSFLPEYVGSRSVGFALARNRAQPGLFHQDDEVPFDSLAAVAEFVRRSYLRGAGGDGTGENGGSAPPPSPEGGEPRDSPDGLRGIESGGESATGTDPAAALLAVATMNSTHSRSLKIGMSSLGETLSKPIGAASTTDTRRRRLARGALRVLRELIRRRPNGQPDKLHWVSTLEKLLLVLTRMALWPVMVEEFHNHDAAAWLFGRNYQPVDQFDYYLYRFFSEYPERHPFYWLDSRWPVWTMTDMFDDLATFPVPPRTVPFAVKDGQNLQALLSAAAATPEQLLHTKDNALEQECAELAVFAAACLNLGGEYSPGLRYSHDDSYVEFVDRLANRSQTWLGGNVPRFVYAPEVEMLIAQASAIPA